MSYQRNPRPLSCHNASESWGDAVHLLFVGDWGRNGSPVQRRVARGMERVAAQLPCSAVVTTGDNFYEDGVASVRDPHWRESFNDVYRAPSLQVPWFACLGNHDYRGEPQAQVVFTDHDPRWYLPSRHYTVQLRDPGVCSVQLFVLDTTPLLTQYRCGPETLASLAAIDPEAQLSWLRDALARSSATWKIVVAHHPMLSGSPVHGSAPELERSLGALLRGAGVHAYVCGHEHDLQHLHDGSMHHLVSGAGSHARMSGTLEETRFCRGDLGFLALSFDRVTLKVRFHDADGGLIYSARERNSLQAPTQAA